MKLSISVTVTARGQEIAFKAADIANLDSRDYHKHAYVVCFDDHMGLDSGVLVFADNESDAIDEACDFLTGKGESWHIVSNELAESDYRQGEDYPGLHSAGNDGEWVNSETLHVVEID